VTVAAMINLSLDLLVSTTASVLVSLSAQLPGSAIEGRYVASSGTEQCRLVLMAPARRPEDSRLSPDTVSGLAAAQPGCALPLSETGLWTLSEEGTRLTLSGFGGAALWSGQSGESGSWAGVTPDGQSIALHPG
jgi:hypothetical protein